MKKLITPRFCDYRRSAYAAFMRIVAELLQEAGPDLKNALGPLAGHFLAWLDRLEAHMLWTGMKIINADLAACNGELNHALSALGGRVRGIFRYSSDSVAVKAAERLLGMLEHYGRVRDKPYDVQIGDIRSILANLNGAFAADVTALSLEGPRDALEAVYNRFIALTAERGALDNAKPEGTFRAVRKGIEDVYRKIGIKVNSGAELGLSPDFDKFIAALNPEIKRLNSAHKRAARTQLVISN
jgi:hypothetical protein